MKPPRHLTLDIDAFDDPAHGQQQLIMFHGYYEQYQYLPIVITCAENDMVLLVGLRHGTCHASLGVDNDLRYLMGRLRAVWPDVQIHVRGDSGLGVPLMYDVCQELRLSYTFGIGMNSRLRAVSDDLLKQALEEYERTGQPQRLFLLVDYQAESWPASQPVVIKVEANAQGTNRRAVVTNRPGCRVLPPAIYDEYAMRGESENRNKELKIELHAGRLSDHRFLANFFRLYLHAAALNLLVRLRHAVVQPPPTSAELGLPAELPTEALDEPAPQEVLQQATRARSAGRRFRLHLADPADQGGRGGDRAGAADDRAAVGELAAPGPFLAGQPGREFASSATLHWVSPVPRVATKSQERRDDIKWGGGRCTLTPPGPPVGNPPATATARSPAGMNNPG